MQPKARAVRAFNGTQKQTESKMTPVIVYWLYDETCTTPEVAMSASRTGCRNECAITGGRGFPSLG
jgi:hypothetical protein